MTVHIDGIDYLSVAEVAKQLATTEVKILMLLRKGALTGQQVDGAWLVTAASVAGYDPEACEPASPPSCRTSCSASSCGCH